MRTKEFFDLAQCQAYCGGTVMMYDGEPVYIDAARHAEKGGAAPFEISTYDIRGDYRRAKWVNVGDERLDYTPVELGMISTVHPERQDYNSAWAARIPVRKWKIGLAGVNTGIFPIDKTFNGAYWDRSHFVQDRALYDTIKGNHWPFNEAVARAVRGRMVAFSRRFAVYNDNLYFKAIGRPVGKIVKGRPELSEDFQFLSEVLQEDMQ